MNKILFTIFITALLLLAYSVIKDQSTIDSPSLSDTSSHELADRDHGETPKSQKIIRNLIGIEFSDKEMLQELLDQLANQALEKNDAYLLSIPLIASAILGEMDIYGPLQDKISELLTNDAKNEAGYKAWLWGRVLLAGYHINDTVTEDHAYAHLASLLTSSTEDSPFATWGYGYKAIYEALNKNIDEYNNSLAQGVSIAENLALPEKKADLLWAQVLFLSATAFADDRHNYDLIFDHMTASKNEDGEKSNVDIIQALNGINEDDWRAWGLALARFSIARTDPKNPIIEPLTDAVIQSAENTTSEGNKLLSLLTLAWSQNQP